MKFSIKFIFFIQLINNINLRNGSVQNMIQTIEPMMTNVANALIHTSQGTDCLTVNIFAQKTNKEIQ